MATAVAKQFTDQPDVWLETWNEPYNWQGKNFSDAMWLRDAIEMVENIRYYHSFNIWSFILR